jgi:ammonia channel protein AmtB
MCTVIFFLCHVFFFQTSISKPGDADIVGLAVINTIIGGSAGGIVVLFFNKFVLGQKWSYLMTLNGALTGKEEEAKLGI